MKDNNVTEIKIAFVSADNTSGLRRWKLDADDARHILEWLDGDTSHIRYYRKRSGGGLFFQTGGGYNLWDADLLGGIGDGETERRFTEDTGIKLKMLR